MALIRTMFTEAKREEVKKLFEVSTHQADALFALFGMVIPNFETMRKYNGFPKAGNEISLFVARLYMTFDSMHHPNVMPGGLWMNYGFSTLYNQHLDPWEVEVNTDEIEYEESHASESNICSPHHLSVE